MSEQETTVAEKVEKVFTPFIEIEGTQYQVKKLHAFKVAKIANLFANLILGGNRKLRELKLNDLGGNSALFAILAILSEEDLVSLAALLIDVDPQFAKENFDLVWVTEALGKQIQISNLKAIVENFTSIASQIQ